MRSESSGSILDLKWIILALAILLFTSVSQAQSGSQAPGSAQPIETFDTPQKAADALIQAAGAYDVPALLHIFGPEGKSFIASADPVKDKNIAAAFAAMAAEQTRVDVDPKTGVKAVLIVGANDWPFPVPLLKKGTKWYFDSKQGAQEILLRRIGGNELDAIQICRGFVEAQKAYALEIHDNSGVNQYAQRIISTPGKQDGLYWENADGTPGGPISEAIARAIQEGYTPGKTSGYHGYNFKVLKGQGPAAPLGRLDYVVEGIMIGGFGLLAFPAEYRVTGVKTFMVSYDGVVYEKDLGVDTLNIVQGMDLYNPDRTWHRTNDEWPPDVVSGNDSSSTDGGN